MSSLAQILIHTFFYKNMVYKNIVDEIWFIIKKYLSSNISEQNDFILKCTFNMCLNGVVVENSRNSALKLRIYQARQIFFILIKKCVFSWEGWGG